MSNFIGITNFIRCERKLTCRKFSSVNTYWHRIHGFMLFMHLPSQLRMTVSPENKRKISETTISAHIRIILILFFKVLFIN